MVSSVPGSVAWRSAVEAWKPEVASQTRFVASVVFRVPALRQAHIIDSQKRSRRIRIEVIIAVMRPRGSASFRAASDISSGKSVEATVTGGSTTNGSATDNFAAEEPAGVEGRADPICDGELGPSVFEVDVAAEVIRPVCAGTDGTSSGKSGDATVTGGSPMNGSVINGSTIRGAAEAGDEAGPVCDDELGLLGLEVDVAEEGTPPV